MKRKTSKISSKYPSPNGHSFPSGFEGNRSFKTRLNPSVSRGKQDIGCRKQFKFVDLGKDKLPEGLSSVLFERNRPPGSDDPKTSEYAFFKKLKGDASNRVHSHSLHPDNVQSKKLKSSDSSKERTNIANNSCNEFSSIYTQNISPDNFLSFHLPAGNASKKSVAEVAVKRDGRTLEDVKSLGKNMEECDAQYRNEDIFTRKRRKLRKWLADTSLPDIDELCSKGYDIVSMLMSKLFPKSDEDKSFEVLKIRQVGTDSKSKWLSCIESDIHFKEFHQMPAMNILELEHGQPLDACLSSYWLKTPRTRKMEFEYGQSLDAGLSSYWLEAPKARKMELECGQSLDVGLSSYWLEAPGARKLELECGQSLDAGMSSCWLEAPRARKMELEYGQSLDACLSSYWLETPRARNMDFQYGQSLDGHLSSSWLESPKARKLSNSNTPTCYSHQAYLDNRITELDCELEERATSLLCTEGDSACGFLTEECGSLTCSRIKELDEFYYPNKSLHEREAHALLLGWDFEKMTDERNSAITYQNTELSRYPILSDALHDQQTNLDNRFSASGIGLPFLLSYHHPNLPSVQCSLLANYGSHSFGENLLEVKDDMLAVLSKFSLPLSHMPEHLNVTKLPCCDTTHKGSSVYFSPFMNKMPNEVRHYPGTNFVLSCGHDFGLEQKCLPIHGSSIDRQSSRYLSLEFPKNESTSSQFSIKGDYETGLDDLNHRGGEDMVNFHDCPSLYFKLYIDKQKESPLLDKSF